MSCMYRPDRAIPLGALAASRLSLTRARSNHPDTEVPFPASRWAATTTAPRRRARTGPPRCRDQGLLAGDGREAEGVAASGAGVERAGVAVGPGGDRYGRGTPGGPITGEREQVADELLGAAGGHERGDRDQGAVTASELGARPDVPKERTVARHRRWVRSDRTASRPGPRHSMSSPASPVPAALARRAGSAAAATDRAGAGCPEPAALSPHRDHRPQQWRL